MHITSIVSRKGGNGKTATAQILGDGLIKQGYKVLFIDLDSQMNLSFTLGADLSTRLTSFEVLYRDSDDYRDMRHEDIKNCIQSTEQGDVIPGSQYLSLLDGLITDDMKQYRLRESLEAIKDRYDYIIIDTPAQLGNVTTNALTASDDCVIPICADVLSFQGLGLLKGIIDTVRKKSNESLYVNGILLTRYNARTVMSRKMKEELPKAAAALDTEPYKTEIRECVAIREAAAMRVNLFEYAPRSNAATDYNNFISEYKERSDR